MIWNLRVFLLPCFLIYFSENITRMYNYSVFHLRESQREGRKKQKKHLLGSDIISKTKFSFNSLRICSACQINVRALYLWYNCLKWKKHNLFSENLEKLETIHDLEILELFLSFFWINTLDIRIYLHHGCLNQISSYEGCGELPFPQFWYLDFDVDQWYLHFYFLLLHLEFILLKNIDMYILF